MSKRFAGKVALVTGASSGIGRASAVAFAREGAQVALADVNIPGSDETRRMIIEQGGDAIVIQADVSQASQVETMVKTVVATYGRLDFAHNNAGILGTLAMTVECTEENWEAVIGVNLKGVWLCMKHEIPQMLTQGGGAIVNTSSVDGLVGARNRPAYVASKHGVIGLTKAAMLEYTHTGIRINAVCPAAIRTPMRLLVTGGDPEIEARVDAWHPIGRQGRPEEVAEVVVWLCSEAASFVTGHAVAVDGGSLSF